MKTRAKIIFLTLIIPFLSLIYNLFFTNYLTPLNLISSFSGAVGTSLGSMAVILIFNAFTNLILNKKFHIIISNVNFIIYSILIIVFYVVTNILIPDEANKLNSSYINNEIVEYNAQLSIDSNNSSLYFKRGSVYLNSNNYNKAIYDFTRAISLDSSFVDAYNMMAYALLQMKDYQNSIRYCTKAIQLNPNNERAYYIRSISKKEIGDNEGSQIDMTRVGNPNTFN
jgi:tetratricopeptide (TPR) repeat protein